jgi:SGT1 protein
MPVVQMHSYNSGAAMDIFNQSPSISEDTIQYVLYPPSEIQSERASVTTYATCMRIYVESLLPNFIWHRDAFELKVVSDPDEEGWILEGRMRVGDCVDDEWCVVWLLKQISAKWDVAVRYVLSLLIGELIAVQPSRSVSDSDGEFLLIEAAEALPAWLTPTNSENRVRPHCVW